MILPEKYSVLELLIYLNKFYLKKNSVERFDFIEYIASYCSANSVSSVTTFSHGDSLGIRFNQYGSSLYLNLLPKSNWCELQKNFIYMRFFNEHRRVNPLFSNSVSIIDLTYISEIIKEEGFDEVKVNLINRNFSNECLQSFNILINQLIEFIHKRYGEV